MPEYSAKLNIEKALGTENVNRDYFMRVIDDIDGKAGEPNGLAMLDQNGNVLKADGSLAGEVTKLQFDQHTEKAATIMQPGHVQLSDAVTSTDTGKAATSNAVKKAYDRADAAFTSASNGKAAIKNAVAGVDPRVVVPADPTFAQLATGIGQIQTGRKFASGTGVMGPLGEFTVNTLTFKPSVFRVVEARGTDKIMQNKIYFDEGVSPDKAFMNVGTGYNIANVTLTDSSFHIARTGSYYLSGNVEWIAYE